MKKMLLGLIIAAGMLLPTQAYGEFIRVKGLVWDSEASGDLKLSSSSLIGSKISLESDLGIKESASIPELEGKLKIPFFGKMVVTYGMGSYDGRRVITQNVNFGGTTYYASDTLRTSMDVTMGSAMLQWIFIPESLLKAFPSLATAEFGLLIGAQYIGMDTKITSSIGGSTEEKTNLPIPVIGGFAQIGFLNQFQFELSVAGVNINTIKTGTKKANVTYSDIYAEVRMNDIYKGIPLGLGYKAKTLNAGIKNGQDFSADFSFKGFYLFSGFSF